MNDFIAWCISQHIDEQPFRAFINRMYISPTIMMTNRFARALAWREFLVNYYIDEGLLWTMITGAEK